MRSSGPITARLDPFIGIPDPDRIIPADISGDDVCTSLFPAPRSSSAVPVAVFTDVNCPYCRPMENWLADIDASVAAVSWHQLPLLGAESRDAARAIVAAEAQGAGAAMRTRLHRTRFAPEPAFLRQLAVGMDLDADKLLTDMARPRTDAEIAQNLGLAGLFGIAGTPAVVVGRTLVVGALTRPEFDALVKQEREARANWPCT